MKLKFLSLLFSCIAISGCVPKVEPHSVFIEFNLRSNDGSSRHFDKTFSSIQNMMKPDNVVYECKVDDDGTEYQIGFYGGSYPVLAVPVVSISYSLGKNVGGTGLAMSGREFQVHSDRVSIRVEIFRTSFLDQMRKEFPKFHQDNLPCVALN